MPFPCRVRFAPSPTGNLHLGSLRTALINFLWAKKNKGSFILRIEDTDQKRIVSGCAEQFEKTLNHFNLKLNESPKLGGLYWPYVQSQRIHLYKFYSDILLDSNDAYHCFCDNQRLEILRRNAANQNSNVWYDGRCSHLSRKEVEQRLLNGESSVIRFKFRPGKVHFNDKIFGECVHEVDESDFIIIKSDGYPTYHFANVVDDHSMQITAVIRGAEWLSSIPKHIQLYKAFKWRQPTWAHLPLITRDGNKKLSKRDLDAFVDFYDNQEGYLPLAILNFLLRNGSGIRNFNSTHLYTLDEMIDCFDENLITRKDFMMDQNKLKYYGRLSFLNADFKTVLLPEILTRLKLFIKKQNIIIKNNQIFDANYILRVIEFLKKNEESFCKLSELFTKFFFFFYWPEELIAKTILEKTPKDLSIKWLKIILSLNFPTEWNNENLKNLVINNTDSFNFIKLTNLIRVALIGQTSGPPISELITFFSYDEIRNRLTQTIALLKL